MVVSVVKQLIFISSSRFVFCPTDKIGYKMEKKQHYFAIVYSLITILLGPTKKAKNKKIKIIIIIIITK